MISEKSLAQAIFYGMRGSWSLERQVTSKTIDLPTMTFSGTATFVETHNGENGLTYSYNERGQAENGMEFKMSYIYKYNKITDEIIVFKGDGEYYHTILNYELRGDTCHASSSHHMCGPDHYDAKYMFTFSETKLRTFKIDCVAKGPHKDYRHSTIFSWEGGVFLRHL
eukprot:Phypoly_transcript_19109.p1 GENE.Phypoly_transcript_19109~~Phypoly_transcript_19109.p1  ORF type:complete len:168 (+),score=14.84 Phypoly_transcript_19109:42-545(+)